MPYDFDKVIDRRQTNSDKWDGMEDAYGVSPKDGLAMWTADMDFVSPPAVNATLARLVELRYFAGLTIRETADVQGVTTTSVERGWRVARMWLRKTLGPRDDDEE